MHLHVRLQQAYKNIATKLLSFFCWSAKDKAHLGLGTVLYLNLLRWLLLIFFINCILSLPNILINAKGPRYTLSSFNGDFLAFASTHFSIANLGSQDYTPIIPQACNNNGFAAKVCQSWSSSSINEYDYPCGYTPPNTFTYTSKSLTYSILSGELNIKCENVITKCYCYDGYSGNQCETILNSTLIVNKSLNKKVQKSFCETPIKWYEQVEFKKRIELYNENRIVRINNVCNGHGSCFTRTSTDEMTVPLYSFCQCDVGFYGPYCEFTVNGGLEEIETFGSFFNLGIINNDTRAKSSCNKGALPSIERTFVFSLPSATCSSHGFGIYMPTKSDGSLNISNAYRVQSRGVCFCEPGYTGEECLGGEEIPSIQGYLMCIHSLFMAIVCCLLYQHRKYLEQAVDDANVSPRDFSIFVNHLPVLKSTKQSDIQRVWKHFEQFGPLYSIIPAINDENIFYFQSEQNRALLALQKMLERKVYEERLKGIVNTNVSIYKDAMKQSNSKNKSIDWKIRPSWFPRLSPLVESKIRDTCIFLEPVTPSHCVGVDSPTIEAFWDSFLWFIRPLSWLIFTLDYLPMAALRSLIRHLEGLLVDEVKDPETTNFERAFITFEHQASRDACLNAYSERAKLHVRPSGEFSYINTTTKERVIVNIRFPKLDSDVKVSLFESLGKSIARSLRTSAIKSSPISSAAPSLHSTIYSNENENKQQIDHHNDQLSLEQVSHEQESTNTTINPLSSLEQESLTTINPLSSLSSSLPSSKYYSSVSSKLSNYIVKSSSTSTIPLSSINRRQRVSLIASSSSSSSSLNTLISHSNKSISIKVSLASEPDEVIWDALDTPQKELVVRGLLVSIYMFCIVFLVFIIITTLNSKKETGSTGFLISLLVVCLNSIIAAHWYLITPIEQNYSIGKNSRSIYLKALITQITTTILSGTIGVYGYPVDSKNGYIQDWYAEAGSFLLNTMIIETLIPFLLVLIPIKWINMKLTEYTSGYASYTEWMSLHEPPSFALESRCASLIRTVLLCCAFQSGLPVLSIACTVFLFSRYICDIYTLENTARIQRSGAELARAVEVSLIFATLVLACMSWVLLRAGQATSALHVNAEIVFFICLFFILWALSGYVSFKRFQKRDCCFGYGFSRLPKKYPNPLLILHESFMRLIFGDFFFNEHEDTFDETDGKTYSELSRQAQEELKTGLRKDGQVVKKECLSSHFLMRFIPYEMKERTQRIGITGIGIGVDNTAPFEDLIPYAPDWTALHMTKWLEAIEMKMQEQIGGDVVKKEDEEEI